MDINVINDKDFKIKPFENQLTKNSSYINVLENNNSILQSLQNLGMVESDLIMDPNSKNQQFLEITNHCSLKDYSQMNIGNLFSLTLESDVMNVRFNETGDFLAAGLLNGYLALIDMSEAQLRYMIPTSTKKFSISSLRWKRDQDTHIITAVNAEGSVSSYNLATQKQRFKIYKKNIQFLSMDYDLNGDQFLLGDNEGNIRLINEHTEKEIAKFESASFFSNGHTNRVFAVKFIVEKPNIFISGGWDGMIFVWDIRDKKPVNSLSGPKISGDSLDYKQNQILIGSYNMKNPLSLWDFRTMEKITDIKPFHNNDQIDFAAYSAQFLPQKHNMSILACSSHPNCMRVFEQKNQSKSEYFHSWSVDGFQKGVYSLHVSPNSKYVALGSADKTISVLNINNFEQLIYSINLINH